MSPAPLRSTRFTNMSATFTATAHVSCGLSFSNTTIFLAKVALVGARLYLDEVLLCMDRHHFARHLRIGVVIIVRAAKEERVYEGS